jgi:quercetin dioxygenase-like cupin family protein
MSAFDRAFVAFAGKERLGRHGHGGPILIRATAADTGGTYGIWETISPPGTGPGRHVHTREAELFQVLEGTYRMECGDDAFEISAGSLVVLPPNVPHAWTNISDRPGRMLGMVTPGGFETMFLDIAAENLSTHDEIVEVHARYGVTLF